MCAPFSQDDDLPELPGPEAALKRLVEAETARLFIGIDLERGRLIHRHTCRDANARLQRATADVQRCRIELEQALIGQALGKAYIGRPTSTGVVEAMQTRLRHNESVIAIEAHANRQAARSLEAVEA